ncbi:uncharacterized protein LOC110031406 [Phalaenopsis equestris]|uniref:uncharacterized protein LOC110031406 n=1 Tax=Phalaenopsis equestris TaxID=78828 RepID=UPI0009E284BC|nr:uncharacterized protein LOC110031406 [Phalaenopsis equestris]
MRGLRLWVSFGCLDWALRHWWLCDGWIGPLRRLLQDPNPLRVGMMASLIKWQPPPFEWIKVNSNGSWESAAAGASGVFHDYLGKCLCFFTSLIVASSPLEAEYWGFLLSIQVAISCKFFNLSLETDSFIIYKDFGVGTVSNWNVEGN